MNERVVAETAQETPDKLVRFRAKRLLVRRSFRPALSDLLAGRGGARPADRRGGDRRLVELGDEQPARYTMAALTHGPIARTVTATGTVNPELTIIVGTYVSGVIQELYCDYNTEVKKGQVCAKIDPRPYQTIVDQSKANLAVAQAQLEKDKANLTYAKVRYERTARLVQTNATSQDAVDTAKSNYEQAQAQIMFDEATIQQRQAVLDAAQVNLDYTNIVSPVDGDGRVAQRDGRTDGRRELPDADAVPDRDRPDQDAGRHQCQRKRHRRRQGRRSGRVHRRRLPQASLRGQGEPGPPVAADRAERRHL